MKMKTSAVPDTARKMSSRSPLIFGCGESAPLRLVLHFQGRFFEPLLLPVGFFSDVTAMCSSSRIGEFEPSLEDGSEPLSSR